MRQIDPKRIEAVQKLLDENRNITHREIAAKLKIGQTSAWKICAMLRPEGVVRKPRVKSKKLGKTAAQTLELITENPAISRKEIGAILHRDSSTISKAVTELVKHGYLPKDCLRECTRNRGERLVIVREYFLKNPNATAGEAADALGLKKSTVNDDRYLLRARGELPPAGPDVEKLRQDVLNLLCDNPNMSVREIAERFGCGKRLANKLRDELRSEGLVPPPDARCYGETLDVDLWNQRVVRDPWYVAEVCGKGLPGMQLPPDAWARYLQCYEKRRQGTFFAELIGASQPRKRSQ